MAQHLMPALARVGDLEIRLIRVFKAVVESGGFTAAVPTLGISRSAISIHMADLEARVGLKLCQRGRSGFALTEEGREIYDAAQRLLSAMETFRTEVNGLHRELRGELNIGITDNLISLPQMSITNALTRLKTRGPEVQINIHMRPSGEVESGVVDGRFHVGVVPRINPLSALDYQHLYAETAHLYASSSHALGTVTDGQVSLAAIAAADAVVPAFSLPAEGQRRQESLRGTATATDREGIAFLVLTGRYIGYLPAHFAQRWVEHGRMRALRPQDCRYRIDYAAITRRGRRPHRVLETFLAEIGVPATPRS